MERVTKLNKNIPNEFFNTVKKQAIFFDIYNFFDIAIAVKSNQKEQLDGFLQFYPRFRAKQANQKIDATYYIMVETPGRDRFETCSYVIAEENSRLRVKILDDVASAPSYANMLAYNYVAANLNSHFFLHAAVVSWNEAADGLRPDNGLAIVGSSGAGKTTLMLKLLLSRAGLETHSDKIYPFKFLSDEQLVINRATHQTAPFPRSIGIRESVLALFDNIEVEHLEPQKIIGGERKWFVDISEISVNEVGESCRLRNIVFLVNSF